MLRIIEIGLIILIGVFGVVLLSLTILPACNIMANIYRETHKDYFENNNNEKQHYLKNYYYICSEN